jgi:hypothetical protein
MKAKLLIPVCCLLLLVSCNKLENDSQSASRLVIDNLSGYDQTGAVSLIAWSDVEKAGSFYNDNAIATLTAEMLDVSATPTFYNDVIVDQVDVVFTKPGTSSKEGVDVPYARSESVSIKVPAGGTTTEVAFVLITHEDKVKAPLYDLISSGQVIQITATITIHGKDVAGYRVPPVSHSMTVYCADFGDA